MLLTLVRHGESVSNAVGRWQGQGDAELSDRGRRQATALAERLQAISFDRIVASDLQRAAETAAALGRPMTTDPQWREIDLGGWEGLTREEVAERFPEQVEALRRGEDVALGGVERWSDVQHRVGRALDRLRADAAGERVLLVAHGGVIITLLSALVGVAAIRPRRLGKLGNTSISQVRFGDATTLEVYNDTEHAPEAATDALERARGKEIGELQAGSSAEGAALARRVAREALPARSPARLAPLLPGRRGLVLPGDEGLALQAWNLGFDVTPEGERRPW